MTKTAGKDTSSKPDRFHVMKTAPRGKPKSGRPWKAVKERYSTLTIDKSVRSSWKKKMQVKAEQKSVKNFEKQLREERSLQLQMRRQRTEENKKRRLENERKSEVVQHIKNTAKIKRMKKKQLRRIEKR